jgi:hypothetical protein
MSKFIAQLKRIVLFLLSPFIALAYMAVFPGVALRMMLSGEKGESRDSGGAA